MRIVVPDQRNVPATAGEMCKNAGTSFGGTRPSGVIDSEKTTRISLASSTDATSPDGPALTIRRGERGGDAVWELTVEAANRSSAAERAARYVIGTRPVRVE